MHPVQVGLRNNPTRSCYYGIIVGYESTLGFPEIFFENFMKDLLVKLCHETQDMDRPAQYQTATGGLSRLGPVCRV